MRTAARPWAVRSSVRLQARGRQDSIKSSLYNARIKQMETARPAIRDARPRRHLGGPLLTSYVPERGLVTSPGGVVAPRRPPNPKRSAAARWRRPRSRGRWRSLRRWCLGRRCSRRWRTGRLAGLAAPARCSGKVGCLIRDP